MMLATDDQKTATAPGRGEDPEALIREARRLQRRRWAARAAIGAVVLGAVAAVVALAVTRHHSGVVNGRAPASATAGRPTVALKAPTALAISRAGVLYIVDPSRDQILDRLPGGRFTVVAGTGRDGFSGDGGLATKAALRLNGNSSVVIGANGTVFFTDTDNNRVRAVLPNGRIETVAGDGHRIPRNVNVRYLTSTRQALRTELVDPGGLAFGPGGKLYISAQDIVALTRSGKLSYFAGPTSPRFSAQDRLLEGPGSDIAFDRAGDMFVSNFPSLSERTATGRILFLGNGFRGGILASSPDGTVYDACCDTGGVFNKLVDPQPVPNEHVMSTRGVRSVLAPHILNRVLGPSSRDVPNEFGPNGLAIGPGGVIYTDTDAGYWSSVGALVEVKAHDRVQALWTSRSRRG